MNYKDMIEKTALRLIGICKGVNEYIKPDTGQAFYSVDVEIKGTRMPVNVKLPNGYNKSKLIPFEIIQLDCAIIPSYDRKGIQLQALPNLGQ